MVYLLPTTDQIEITDQVATFLSSEFPLSRLRDGSVQYDLSRWEALIEYGLTALATSPEAGGSGLPATDEALIFRQLGHALITPAILASAMVSRIAADSGRDDIAAAIAKGSSRACLALSRERESRDSGLYLIDSEGADFVLVATTDLLEIYSIDAFAQRPGDCLDESLSLALADRPRSPPLFVADDRSRFITQFLLLCSAQLVGISEHARDLAVDYAKTREQFGKAIGTFQAIKHQCADMSVRTEIALAQFYRAAVCCRDEDADAAFHVAAAFHLASRAATMNATVAIQVHGGIGFTAECDVHWLLKRARVLDALNISPLGGPGAFLQVELADREGETENV
jgi:alkylation response protein AidB-like acyl-CoA dehydrogenase